MTEQLKVTQVEASVNLVNEIFGRVPYNPEVAQVLHGYGWKNHYRQWENEEAIKPESFLLDSQKSQLLMNSVTTALGLITARERKAVCMRFGLEEDGIMHTLREIGSEFETQRERPRQIVAGALRKLRHPSRANRFKQFLPERQIS